MPRTPIPYYSPKGPGPTVKANQPGSPLRIIPSGPPPETVKIVHQAHPSGYVEINASDFDDATMTLYQAP